MPSELVGHIAEGSPSQAGTGYTLVELVAAEVQSGALHTAALVDMADVVAAVASAIDLEHSRIHSLHTASFAHAVDVRVVVQSTEDCTEVQHPAGRVAAEQPTTPNSLPDLAEAAEGLGAEEAGALDNQAPEQMDFCS